MANKKQENERPKAVLQVDWFDSRFYKVTLLREIFNQFCRALPKVWAFEVPQEPTLMDAFFPSSTTIIGEAYTPSFIPRLRGDLGNREVDQRLQEAGDIGSAVHLATSLHHENYFIIYKPPHLQPVPDAIENQIKEKAPVHYTYSQEVQLMVERYLDIMAVLGAEVIQNESKIYHYWDMLYFAGTLDRILKIAAGEYYVSGRDKLQLAGGLYVADLKTGKVVDNSAFIQVSSYAEAYERMTGQKVAGALVFHLNGNIKTGIKGVKVLHKTRDELQLDFEQFKNYYRTFLYNDKGADGEQKSRPKYFQIRSLIPPPVLPEGLEL